VAEMRLGSKLVEFEYPNNFMFVTQSAMTIQVLIYTTDNSTMHSTQSGNIIPSFGG